MFMERTTAPAAPRVVRAEEGNRFDVLGAHLVWKARGEDTADTFTVAVQTLSQRESIPRHQHRYPEVFYILSGELEFTLHDGADAATHTVRKGDTVVVETSTDHSVRNSTDLDASLLDIASVSHQQFFDTVQREAPHWVGLTPDETMRRVGDIGRQHMLDFWEPQ
jgi:quercetin dioxygenase-like cupin family protein